MTKVHKGKKVGRPKEAFKQDIANEICIRLGLGEGLREICRDPSMPDKSTVMRWLASNAGFRDQYAGAREAQADYMAEEILEISDEGKNDFMERRRRDGSVEMAENHEAINRSRLRVDIARMAPKKYGDRVTTEHVGKDGGPIETANVTDIDAARWIAMTLERGRIAAQQAGEGASASHTLPNKDSSVH
jgi:hypothetical protein